MHLNKLVIIAGCLTLSGCVGTLDPLFNRQAIDAPKNWQDTQAVSTIDTNWLASFQRDDLSQLVQLALQNNLDLKKRALDVSIAEQKLTQANSSFFPDLDFSFSQKRANSASDANPTNTSSLGLDLSYELDVWGKLSDQAKQATQNLNYAQATFEQARQQLAADVATAWLKVIETRQLLELYDRRVQNARNNLAIIESGYEKGLNEARDVYLGRNELDSELSRVANQRAAVSEARRTLERYLGDYPKGQLQIDGEIPTLTQEIAPGLPEDLISRKASLAASWNNLQSKNAALAYAHKQRLPALNLSAALTETADLPKNLFDGSAMIWSLLGSVTAPIFDAGELKSKEEVARLELRQAEYQYLNDVYDAYQAVENAITREASLKQQYSATQLAEQNARTALDLSFEQYQRGLIEYTSVLDSQSRLHDAENSLIQIKSELVANRINLHVALGGDFQHSEAQ